MCRRYAASYLLIVEVYLLEQCRYSNVGLSSLENVGLSSLEVDVIQRYLSSIGGGVLERPTSPSVTKQSGDTLIRRHLEKTWVFIQQCQQYG